MRVYSVPGRLVRDPATRRVVDADGVDVNPLDPHWVRLINDEDVSLTPPPADSDEPAGSSPKKKTAASGPEA